MAEQSGLAKLYDLFYGHMSLLAHGNATEFLLGSQAEPVSANVEAARSMLEAIHLIVLNRVRECRYTTVAEIEAILHVTSVASPRSVTKSVDGDLTGGAARTPRTTG